MAGDITPGRIVSGDLTPVHMSGNKTPTLILNFVTYTLAIPGFIYLPEKGNFNFRKQ